MKTEVISTFESLSHRVALACDVWRNVECVDYIRVMAHWIDSDWCMHRRIINFRKMLYIPISVHVKKSIEAMGIKDKTIFVTVDEICDDAETMEDLRISCILFRKGHCFGFDAYVVL